MIPVVCDGCRSDAGYGGGSGDHEYSNFSVSGVSCDGDDDRLML